MNHQQQKKREENLFPVFRFNLDNRIVFANKPAQSILNHWKCSLDEKIPATIISMYPELFHAALSHKPMDVTVEMESYSIRFSIVPFPEAGYIGMYAYCMEQNANYTGKTTIKETIKVETN